ncbi:hypothetical protein PSU4_53120 [Pseudonocardia sulfidoxydans NBRC 16205]|uniref:Winged helix DNA-binding domain-containing protein n=1 Tax=Pseudonocardia sulfidoxydans NBRC 16205 TaxID=1223511 RepID=A0A511DTG3_9PSEU|nr:winged helix DNA-binding domain-containing protein [Pseudonocardia sulfidoxydans]GEL26358.1 hypothetical protein PSU4_53120 [Pseudonocardia sulfidoxydans NBRC 16205]
MRVLTRDALNRALLARQGLLERVRVSPERGVERFGGLQTQYAPSGYVGLFSRLDGFTRDDLTAALTAGRVVQAWMMRCTIHMVSRADYAPLTAAVRLPRRGYWMRLHKAHPEERFVEASALVRRRLEDGPATQAELAATLTGAGLDRALFPGTQLWTDMVRVPPAGTWDTPRAHVYGLAAAHLGAAAPGPEPPDVVAAGEELLVRRHLRAFGPASAADIARWAGVTVGTVRAVLARLHLRRFRAEDGTELVDLPRTPLPDPRVPAPVRFLSTFDAVLLLGHAYRAGVVPAGYRDRVFHRSIPQSVPTVLVDGRVAGSWRVTDGRVVVEPFTELTARQAREVAAEAERLAAFRTG